MEIAFTWNVKEIVCAVEQHGNKNVVIQVYWDCAARTEVDGKAYLSVIKELTTVDAPAQDSPFIEFEELTQDLLLSWVFKNGMNQAGYEAALTNMLRDQVSPTTVTLMPPWKVARV